MHEGPALFIVKGHDNDLPAPVLISISVYFMVTVIRVVYNGNLELDEVMVVLSTIYWEIGPWSICRFALSKFRLESALLVTVVKLLVAWLFLYTGDTILGRGASIFILMVSIPDILYLNMSRRLAKYSIRIEWKEIRSLFGNRNHSHGLV